MRYFKLPDLGEGLREAEIVEWHVSEGDTVEADQVLVSVETDKAVVEVPSPQAGTIRRCFGAPGDILHVGEALVEFDVGEHAADDAGTVVGELERGEGETREDHFFVGAPPAGSSERTGPRPGLAGAVRKLADELGVDVGEIAAARRDGQVGTRDVERAHELDERMGPARPIRSVRRTMARNMARAHAEVADVSIFDDADIGAWPEGEDATIRLVRAIAVACAHEPVLNGWLDGDNLTRRLPEHIDLGIAVNTEDGLFVPVLRDVGRRDAADLRAGLDRLRADVQARTIPPREMQGATITLSNYGMIGGKYANPVIVPPTVAIVGAGRVHDAVVPHDGAPAVSRVMPISLTFDHRAATGAEAARFVAALKAHLERATVES